MKIFVFGLNQIGEYIINVFRDHQIIISDEDVELMESIAESYELEYVDMKMIQEIEMDFDIAFFISDNTSANVMLSILSLSKGVKNVICYVEDDTYKGIMEKIGVKALSKTEIAKNIILRSFKEPLYNAIFMNKLDVIGGKNYAGKRLAELKNSLFVINKKTEIIKNPEYIIQPEDTIIVARF